MSTANKGLIPRGIRNNNPGNIRFNPHNKWHGQSGEDAEGFCVFKDAYSGLRAMRVLLINYHNQNDCIRVFHYVHRYAPSTENNITAYLNTICEVTGWVPDYVVRIPEDLPRLMKAIIVQENGSCPYSDKDLKMTSVYYPIIS